MNGPTYRIRSLTTGDLNFVMSSFMLSRRDLYRKMPERCYNQCFSKALPRLIEKPRTKTICACAAADNELIYSYAVGNPASLAFVYTYGAVRRLGLATELICRLSEILSWQSTVAITFEPTDRGKQFLHSLKRSLDHEWIW